MLFEMCVDAFRNKQEGGQGGDRFSSEEHSGSDREKGSATGEGAALKRRVGVLLARHTSWIVALFMTSLRLVGPAG